MSKRPRKTSAKRPAKKPAKRPARRSAKSSSGRSSKSTPKSARKSTPKSASKGSLKGSAGPAAVLKELRAFGLTYPGVEVKSPWPGHDDLAVNGKTFAYLSQPGEPFGISLKLPFTGAEARRLPFASPAGYGLGKSGWVSFEPAPGEMPSLQQLKSWLDESYRAQAPRKLAALVKHKF